MSIDALDIQFRSLVVDDSCPTLVRSSTQTKDWRMSQEWYSTGKSNECEKYQIRLIESITGLSLDKSHLRINMESNSIVDQRKPLTMVDGFDFTENFDGVQIHKDQRFYYNLKFVCGGGGAQTRTLREVYHYIKAQLDYLLESSDKDERFINILDGDASNKVMSKYQHLVSKPRYATIRKRVFVGDMLQFHFVWKSYNL